jgi:hypothetical protein
MVFNATFNNILVISWWSVLLVEYPLIEFYLGFGFGFGLSLALGGG